jgi:hypothetical protein
MSSQKGRKRKLKDDYDQLNFDSLLDQESGDEEETLKNEQDSDVVKRQNKRVNGIVFADKGLENAPKDINFFEVAKLNDTENTVTAALPVDLDKETDHFYFYFIVCKRMQEELNVAMKQVAKKN